MRQCKTQIYYSGVIDTGIVILTDVNDTAVVCLFGVIDTAEAPKIANIDEFSKKLECFFLLQSEPRKDLIDEK